LCAPQDLTLRTQSCSVASVLGIFSHRGHGDKTRYRARPAPAGHPGLTNRHWRGHARAYNGIVTMPPLTMYEKIWQSHLVREEPGQPALIYIDRHLIHEGTSPQAFSGLKAAGRSVRRPDLTFAVMDHSVPTKDRDRPIVDTVP